MRDPRLPANGKARRFVVLLSELSEVGVEKGSDECVVVVPVSDYDHLLKEFFELQRELRRVKGEGS